MIQRAWSWLKEWYIVLITVMVILAILVYSGMQPKRQHLLVPVQFCQSVLTGRSQIDQIPVQQCAGYDKNGVCTAPFTTWYDQTRVEVRVTCDFNEWRTQ